MIDMETIRKNVKQNLLPLTSNPHFSKKNRRLTIIKVIVILLIWIVPIILMALISMNSNSNSNSTVPFFIVIGILAGSAAVWKYKPEPKNDTTSDKQELDKTNN